MQSVIAAARQELQRRLLMGQGPDGGWPYYPGKASRIEPTAWALLALSQLPAVAPEVVARGRAFFRRLQRSDGLLIEPGLPTPNHVSNGLALMADTSVVRMPRGDGFSETLVSALLSVRGIALEDAGPVAQNSRLQAWSWIEGTFSWIEPTAVCVLALKKVRAAGSLARTRLAEAEAVILDRVCEGGGWNYGNAAVLGQDLRPYVPTTALALLAMQDRRDHPSIVASLGWMKTHATSERSAMALSLAALSMQVFGEPDNAPREALVRQMSATIAFDNFHLIAMALCALIAKDHSGHVFQLSS